MARPRQYDRQEVLARAMLLFWEKGYEAASVQDCLDAMGINRSSMYQEFRGKYGLFLSALEYYGATVIERYLRDFDSFRGLDAIRRYFNVIMMNRGTLEGRSGCFIQNMIIERRVFDEKFERTVAGKARVIHRRVEDRLYGALVQAREAGALAEIGDLRQGARFLFTLGQGLIVLGKAENPLAARAARDFLFRLLDSWATPAPLVRRLRSVTHKP